MKALIFVEGIADEKFIKDYLKHLKLSDIETHQMGGKDKLHETKPSFELNFKRGIQNVLILDADDDIEKRQKEIENLEFFAEYNIRLFLFPNHSEKGDLETLLEKIINPSNSEIFNCWNSYENCLATKENSNSDSKKFTTPARKTKIYAYLEALLGTSKKQKEKIKEGKRNYLKVEHWNLDELYLNPLKDFLSRL